MSLWSWKRSRCIGRPGQRALSNYSSSNWLLRGYKGLLDRLLQILISPKPRVHHFARLVQHDDIRGRGDVVGTSRGAFAVEELIAGNVMLRDVGFHALR